MKTVKLLLAGLLIGDVIRPDGDVVTLPDVRADELIGLGHAEPATGPVANPDANMLADVIDPMPLGGVVLPAPGPLAPTVDDNPGLQKLDEITDGEVKKKGAKVANKVV